MVGQVYEGPLDLLLDLIRKQDIDIYDIPIAKITEQYLKYVETIKQFDVDVAAEFIYTASLLIHIKSKMLLPRDPARPRRRGRSAPGAGQSPAGARALQDGGADADAEAADRRGGVVNPALKEFRDAEAPSRRWPPTWSTWSRPSSRFWIGRARRPRSTWTMKRHGFAND